jgi:hypothetical protein
MRKVHSSVTDDQYAKIQKTGIPMYQFLKLGVEAKLNEMRSEEMLDRKIGEFEIRQKKMIDELKNEWQENLVEAVGVMNEIVSDQVSKDAELKEKFNVAMQTILQKLS